MHIKCYPYLYAPLLHSSITPDENAFKENLFRKFENPYIRLFMHAQHYHQQRINNNDLSFLNYSYNTLVCIDKQHKQTLQLFDQQTVNNKNISLLMFFIFSKILHHQLYTYKYLRIK